MNYEGMEKDFKDMYDRIAKLEIPENYLQGEDTKKLQDLLKLFSDFRKELGKVVNPDQGEPKKEDMSEFWGKLEEYSYKLQSMETEIHTYNKEKGFKPLKQTEGKKLYHLGQACMDVKNMVEAMKEKQHVANVRDYWKEKQEFEKQKESYENFYHENEEVLKDVDEALKQAKKALKTAEQEKDKMMEPSYRDDMEERYNEAKKGREQIEEEIYEAEEELRGMEDKARKWRRKKRGLLEEINEGIKEEESLLEQKKSYDQKIKDNLEKQKEAEETKKEQESLIKQYEKELESNNGKTRDEKKVLAKLKEVFTMQEIQQKLEEYEAEHKDKSRYDNVDNMITLSRLNVRIPESKEWEEIRNDLKNVNVKIFDQVTNMNQLQEHIAAAMTPVMEEIYKLVNVEFVAEKQGIWKQLQVAKKEAEKQNREIERLKQEESDLIWDRDSPKIENGISSARKAVGDKLRSLNIWEDVPDEPDIEQTKKLLLEVKEIDKSIEQKRKDIEYKKIKQANYLKILDEYGDKKKYARMDEARNKYENALKNIERIKAKQEEKEKKKTDLEKKYVQCSQRQSDLKGSDKNPVPSFIEKIQKRAQSFESHRTDAQKLKWKDSEEYKAIWTAMEELKECSTPADLSQKMRNLSTAADAYLNAKKTQGWWYLTQSEQRVTRMQLAESIKKFCETGVKQAEALVTVSPDMKKMKEEPEIENIDRFFKKLEAKPVKEDKTIEENKKKEMQTGAADRNKNVQKKVVNAEPGLGLGGPGF